MQILYHLRMCKYFDSSVVFYARLTYTRRYYLQRCCVTPHAFCYIYLRTCFSISLEPTRYNQIGNIFTVPKSIIYLYTFYSIILTQVFQISTTTCNRKVNPKNLKQSRSIVTRYSWRAYLIIHYIIFQFSLLAPPNWTLLFTSGTAFSTSSTRMSFTHDEIISANKSSRPHCHKSATRNTILV